MMTASAPRSCAASTAARHSLPLPACTSSDGEQHLPAALSARSTPVRISLSEKIQPGEVASVGGVAQAQIDRVGACVQGGGQRGKVARWRHQFQDGKMFPCLAV